MYRLATKCTTKNEVHALQTWVPIQRYSASSAASRHSAEFRRCLAVFGDSRTFLRQCGTLLRVGQLSFRASVHDRDIVSSSMYIGLSIKAVC